MTKKKKIFDDIPEKLLMKAIASVADYARRENFALGLPVVILKGQNIIALYPDGKEKVLKKLKTKQKKVLKKVYRLEK